MPRERNNEDKPIEPIARSQQHREAKALADELYRWYTDSDDFGFSNCLAFVECVLKSRRNRIPGFEDEETIPSELIDGIQALRDAWADGFETTYVDASDFRGDLHGDDRDDLWDHLESGVIPEPFREPVAKRLETREADTDSLEKQERRFLEYVESIPFGTPIPDTDWDLPAVRDALDESHYGLEKLKDWILEELAIIKRSGDASPTTLCLCGPPGTGKTSIVQTVADTLGRSLITINLGGLSDESELIGHHRGYRNAQPGQIVRGLSRADSLAPVMLLDEIDKVSRRQGNPTGVLLQLLDPEQHDAFQDNFMEHGLDLSNVLFIATANDPDRIAAPLRDRMELLGFDGYDDAEKMTIARRYLLNEVVEECHLREDELTLTDGTVKRLVEEFTDEPGLRGLKARLETLGRKALLAEDSLRVGPSDLDEYFEPDTTTRDRVGFRTK